jgi:hypothetical protein
MIQYSLSNHPKRSKRQADRDRYAGAFTRDKQRG